MSNKPISEDDDADEPVEAKRKRYTIGDLRRNRDDPEWLEQNPGAVADLKALQDLATTASEQAGDVIRKYDEAKALLERPMVAPRPEMPDLADIPEAPGFETNRRLETQTEFLQAQADAVKGLYEVQVAESRLNEAERAAGKKREIAVLIVAALTLLATVISIIVAVVIAIITS